MVALATVALAFFPSTLPEGGDEPPAVRPKGLLPRLAAGRHIGLVLTIGVGLMLYLLAGVLLGKALRLDAGYFNLLPVERIPERIATGSLWSCRHS